jgi:hypothetical protein
MTSTVLPVAALIVSFLALGTSIITIFVNRNQKRLDNLVSIQQFLHRDDLSNARRAIREDEMQLTLQDARVRQVCSSFEFAGLLVRHGAVNKAIFLDYWREPLIALSIKFSDLGQRNTGRLRIDQYYKYFWWLMGEAKRTAKR